MVSSGRNRNKAKWIGRKTHLTRIYLVIAITVLWMILVAPVNAQINTTRAELVIQDSQDTIQIHIRVPRGQTIVNATATQNDTTQALIADESALPVTQWIVLDGGQEMINLQSAVQTGLQRFILNSDARTGLIIFGRDQEVLNPTDRLSQVESLLTDYTATAGEASCLADALRIIAETNRELDRSLRILVVTAGDFSQVSACESPDFPVMPAPVDMVAITDTIDTALQDMVTRSGGAILTANLRTIDRRISEIRAQWGQPTYVVRGAWAESWDASQPLSLTIALSNNTTVDSDVLVGEYVLPATAIPTVAPTTVLLATVTPRPTQTAEPTTVVTEEVTEEATATVEVTEAVIVATVAPEATQEISAPVAEPPPSNNNIILLWVVGAGLLIVGTISLFFTLTSMRRRTLAKASDPANFYDQLLSPERDDSLPATKIRNRDMIDNPATPVVSALDDTIIPEMVDPDEADELIITQVLSDERFKTMMEASKDLDEVVGWLRLDGTSFGDYELTRRGVLVGRSQDCGIQIKGDRAISRQHARLDVQADKSVTISRMSSYNPVVVGGVAIIHRHPLKNNDVIYLSDKTRLIFISKSPSETDESE